MKKALLIGVLSLLVALFIFHYQRPDGLLHLWLLNIGQGDAILIQTPSGKTILVDGGPGQTVTSELDAVLPFFSRRIDTIAITNPDKDHIEGFIGVLNHYEVGEVWMTGTNNRTSVMQHLLKLIREKNIPVRIVDESDDQTIDGVFIDVLFPFQPEFGINEHTNNYSLVMKVIYGENEILLTGDLEKEGEERLIKAGANLKSDILKAGHHGSKTSSSTAFVKKVSPNYAAISAGKGNKYNHPSPEVLQRFGQLDMKVFRTDLDGRIEFIFSKEGINDIKTEK